MGRSIRDSLLAGMVWIFAWCRPTRSMAARMALSSGAWVNLISTSVPPRNSMPSGMPCQNSMENTPATLNTSEKARKYHFLPRKSMFGLRKNSTLCRSPLSDAERFASLVAAQDPVKNHARNEHGGKQIGDQPKRQGNGKPFDRPGAE